MPRDEGESGWVGRGVKLGVSERGRPCARAQGIGEEDDRALVKLVCRVRGRTAEGRRGGRVSASASKGEVGTSTGGRGGWRNEKDSFRISTLIPGKRSYS
jgi:hypothetical protein